LVQIARHPEIQPAGAEVVEHAIHLKGFAVRVNAAHFGGEGKVYARLATPFRFRGHLISFGF
jgi:hypothetical protein